MTWESRYLPPDPTVWQGKADLPAESCFYQLVQPLNLLSDQLQTSDDKIAFAIVGFKSDEGVERDLGRSGTFEGPTAIRHRLARLPVQRANILCYDVGNIVCTDHDLEASQKALGLVIQQLAEHHICPIVIGGGHDVAFGHYQGIAAHHSPEKKLGIINFDAHFDLYEPHQNRGSSTTAFYQIADAHRKENRHFDYNCIGIQHASNIRQLFDVAKQLKVKSILADEMHQGLQEKCIDFIDRVIDENEIIYVSLSLDVFSSAFAPGVNSIQPLGLNPWHVIPLIRQVAASGKVTNYDIVEHVPRYDIDHRTAKLAATLIYEIIHHHNNKITLVS